MCMSEQSRPERLHASHGLSAHSLQPRLFLQPAFSREEQGVDLGEVSKDNLSGGWGKGVLGIRFLDAVRPASTHFDR